MNATLRNKLAICLAFAALVVLYLTAIDCAPSGNNSNNNNNNNGSNGNNNNRGLIRSGGILSNLFRRQTSGGNNSNKENNDNDSNSGPGNSDTSMETDDPQSQTEQEAQKFMDSLPGANTNTGGPASFRERVSESFGLLREGVSNQFRSLRDNWSETVDDLRDTWSPANSERK